MNGQRSMSHLKPTNPTAAVCQEKYLDEHLDTEFTTTMINFIKEFMEVKKNEEALY